MPEAEEEEDFKQEVKLKRRRGPTLSNEIHATLVDHVVKHGLTVREAGLRVQPNLSRFTVASVIRAFRLENREKTCFTCLQLLTVCTPYQHF